MSGQDQGLVGRMVGGMIRRSVRKQFKAIYWNPPVIPIEPPAIFFSNHHGWHDGYVLYHLVSKLGLRSVDWIIEYDAFPLFAAVGGLPFPRNDVSGRAATIRQTIRLMRDEGRSLVIFPEGELHYPDEVWPFGRALALVAERGGAKTLQPVAIRYEMAMQERPEVFLRLAAPIAPGPHLEARCREAVVHTLEELTRDIRVRRDSFEVLARGTDSVNERLDMRKFRR